MLIAVAVFATPPFRFKIAVVIMFANFFLQYKPQFIFSISAIARKMG